MDVYVKDLLKALQSLPDPNGTDYREWHVMIRDNPIEFEFGSDEGEMKSMGTAKEWRFIKVINPEYSINAGMYVWKLINL